MSKPLFSSTLLTYTSFDLASLDGKCKGEIETLLATIGNEPFELYGKSALSGVFLLFNRLKDIAQEITYRPAQDEKAFMIFTTIDEDEFIRPFDVSLPYEWSMEELTELEAEREKDRTEECAFALNTVWQEASAQDRDNALWHFLKVLYHIAPRKHNVMLQGSCPILPGLMAFAWFSTGNPTIFYRENELAPQELIMGNINPD